MLRNVLLVLVICHCSLAVLLNMERLSSSLPLLLLSHANY